MAISGAVLCLGYILGLLLTGITGSVWGIPTGTIGLLAAGMVAAVLVPRVWRMGPKSRIWLAAAMVGWLASLYFQARIPQPAATDVSRLLSPATITTTASSPDHQQHQLEGTIDTPPRLTQSQRIQFELKVTQAQAIGAPAEAVTGRILVSLPLLQATGLYPGQQVTVTGSLYRPKPATNPGGFDFAQYLAQRGIFAGLRGREATIADPSSKQPLLWSIRQRIIRAQVAGLGVPEGPLLSAMVMGGRAVDVPHDLRDQFRGAGLAHALAASGAQVSLLVGIVLAVTQRLSSRLRLGLGLGILVLYLCLTGLEPSVLRAAVMGAVALLALSLERQVNPIASILFAATLLLLWNPLWVFDLGFQLSFLATLGLLVTVPVLARWLDWLPNGVIPLLSVPIAAYLWTLPLLLFVFGVVSPYSIAINVLVSPLITVISIGGMISALAALLYLPAGSITAWLLHLPTSLFIHLAEWGNQLPGNTWAIGSISLVQVLLLYGLGGLVWWWNSAQRYWWIATIASMGLILLPSWHTSATLLQVTLLSTSDRPVLVVQDRGQVMLINSGSDRDVKFTVLPFLLKHGVNRIDWAIAPSWQPLDRQGWQRLQAHLGLKRLYAAPLAATAAPELADDRAIAAVSQTLHANQAVQFGSVTLRLLSAAPLVLQANIAEQTWLLVPSLLPIEQQPALMSFLFPAAVLWWTGAPLSPELLATVNPAVAIATGPIAGETAEWLQSRAVTTFVRDRDGAVQWTPQTGFRSMLSTDEE
jgi:competence protein ComEC